VAVIFRDCRSALPRSSNGRPACPDQKAKSSIAFASPRWAANRSDFHERMKGTGVLAEQLAQSFKVFKRRFGLDTKSEPLDCDSFRVPDPTGQLRLFE
jgi:hypothetical protein